MGETTKIEWSGSTWNAIRARLKEDTLLKISGGGTKEVLEGKWGYHCEHISPGCVNCYAETMNGRTLPAWGTGLDFNVPNRQKVEIFVDEAELLKPLKWKRPRKVFVCSMTDLFAEFVSDEMIDRVFAVMALAPHLTFQVLTKRAARLREYFADRYAYERIVKAAIAIDGGSSPVFSTGEYPFGSREIELANGLKAWPLPNVHLGVSCEDQQRADERIPLLLQTPAAVRWISHEPALGPVDFTRWLKGGLRIDNEPLATLPISVDRFETWPKLDWGVFGGESGPGARPCDIAWGRSFVAQFAAAQVPAFVKQLGARPVGFSGDSLADCDACDLKSGKHTDAHGWDCARRLIKDRKGGSIEEWPIDLRVRQFPEVVR